MDSKWCPLCKLSHSEWAKPEFLDVEYWTFALMIEKLEEDCADIQNKIVPKHRKGIKYRMILDINPSLYIILPLHIKLGIVNQAFIKPVGYRKCIENILECEQLAFNLFCNATYDLIDQEQDIIFFKLDFILYMT